MIQTPQERQAWHDHLKARFAQPNDVKDRHVRKDGSVLVRTLAKRCPWCRDMFFAYQVEGRERQPYQVDPEPPGGIGARETCGNPQCWASEDRHQGRRRMGLEPEADQAANF